MMEKNFSYAAKRMAILGRIGICLFMVFPLSSTANRQHVSRVLQAGGFRTSNRGGSYLGKFDTSPEP